MHSSEVSDLGQTSHTNENSSAIWFTFAVALGLLLPLSFSFHLRSLLLHQNASQIAVIYLLTAASFSFLAIPSAIPAILGMLLRGRSEKLLATSSLLLATGAGIVGVGFVLSNWLGSLGIIGQDYLDWRNTSLLLTLGFIIVLARARNRASLISATRAISRTLVPFALTLLSAATLIAVLGGVALGTWTRQQPYSVTVCQNTSTQRPDIFLITIDTLSARRMSLYGHTRMTTPLLSAFADGSVVFERAYSSSNFTTPAIASLLTGTHPWTHRAYHIYGMPQRDVRKNNLPASLKSCGYTTAAFVANGLAHPKAHGISTAFDHLPGNYLRSAREWLRDNLTVSEAFSGQSVIDMFPFRQLVNAVDRAWMSVQPDWQPSLPQLQISDAIRFMSSQKEHPAPLFIWTHFYPPHDPYVPPYPFIGRFNPSDKFRTAGSQDFDYGYFGPSDETRVRTLSDRYDEHVLWIDHMVTKYLDQIRQIGRLDRALVVIAADHGESFEHGYWGHIGPYLFESLIQVPLIIRTPGQSVGKRIARPAEIVDIFPTIIDLIGGVAPGGIEGESLRNAIEGDAENQPIAVAMQLDRSSTYGAPTAGGIAIVTDRYKFIHHLHDPGNGDELYDLVVDPDENTNIALTDNKSLKFMRGIALPLLADHATPSEGGTRPFEAERHPRDSR